MIRKLLVCATLAAIAGSAAANDAPMSTDMLGNESLPGEQTGLLVDGILIDSEDQFAQEYANEVEKIASGVYLFTSGDYKGKVIAIGDAGMEYDLAAHRARLKERASQGKAAGMSADIIRNIEQAKHERRKRGAPAQTTTKASSSGPLFCGYWGYNNWGQYGYQTFYGSAGVSANAELYRKRSDGGYNWYYARALAHAAAYVNIPWGAPVHWTSNVCAHAEDKLTGETSGQCVYGGSYPSISAPAVHSGPVFSHDLYAHASVIGEFSCSGYVSISDEMIGVKFPSKN